MNSADVVTALITSQARYEEVRADFEDHQQTAVDYVNPRRYDLDNISRKGAKRKTKMYDGVAQDAMLTWRDGLIGWWVGPGVRTVGPTWHKATLGHIPGKSFEDMESLRKDDSVKTFLQYHDEQMRREIKLSGFYTIEGEWLQDCGSFGTGTVLTEESLKMDRAVLRVPHPGRCWIAQNCEGKVDVFHEKLTLTAQQCLQKYNKPDDTLHPTIRKWAGKAESAGWEITLVQCLRPADDSIFASRMKWSPYVLVTYIDSMHGGQGTSTDTQFNSDGSRLVRIEPLSYLSATVTRMRRNSDELYGYSQAMDVTTAVEAANQAAYNLHNMANLASNPVKFTPSELRGHISFLPGAENTFDSAERVPQYLELGGNYPISIEHQDRIYDLIRARYGYDLFKMMPMYQQKRERNQAREIATAEAQQARLLVSQTANLWEDGIIPVYNNIAAIANRAGRMPEAPAVLQDAAGKDVIDIDCIGPLAQVQEWAASVSPVQQGMEFLASIAEVVGRHVSPEMAAQVYARVKLPDLTEFALDKTGFPRQLMRTDDETQAIIDAIAQQTAAVQQAKQVQQLAAASAQYGKPIDTTSLLAAGVV
jgi:hypothetical protein